MAVFAYTLTFTCIRVLFVQGVRDTPPTHLLVKSNEMINVAVRQVLFLFEYIKKGNSFNFCTLEHIIVFSRCEFMMTWAADIECVE